MINDIKNVPGYENMSPSEILAALQATGVTVGPINRADLVYLLNIRGMLRKIISNNTDEKWTGTVLAMQDVILTYGSDEQKNGIRLWFSHITNPSNITWNTTISAFAAPFWQMVQSFAGGPGMPTLEDFRAVAALGGGWKYADWTVNTIESSLTAESNRINLQEIDSSIIAVKNEYINSAESDPNRTKESVAIAYELAANALRA